MNERKWRRRRRIRKGRRRPTSRREEAGKLPTQPTAPADPHLVVNYLHAFKIIFWHQQFYAEQLTISFVLILWSHGSRITFVRFLNESEVKNRPQMLRPNASVSFLPHHWPCPSTSMRDSGPTRHWGGWISQSNKDKHCGREEGSAFILFNKLGN